MGVPTSNKDMKFKYTCKFCQQDGLAWKIVDNKWTLFSTYDEPHKCGVKGQLIDDNQKSNLKKKPNTKGKKKKTLEKDVTGENVIGGVVDEVEAMPVVNEETNSQEIVQSEGYGGMSIVDILTMKKVNLIDAQYLYQPVYGSSTESTYYVVALYKGLKFAARVKGYGEYTVSFRVEGEDYVGKKHKVYFQKLDDHGSYGSLHVTVGSLYDAKMVISGLLGAVDMESLTKSPNLSNLFK